MRSTNRVAIVASLVALGLLSSVALAQSKKVWSKYKGKVLISAKPFELSDDDAETIGALKKQSTTALPSTEAGEDGATWSFYWLAMLSSKAGTSNATIYFYEKGKKEPATYKDIGCDPDQIIISSDLTITENDGLTKGKTYEVVFAVTNGKKIKTLAKSAPIKFQ